MTVLEIMRSRIDTIGELSAFLWKRKLWWAIPLVMLLALLGLLLLFAQGSGLTPFIYTLF